MWTFPWKKYVAVNFGKRRYVLNNEIVKIYFLRKKNSKRKNFGKKYQEIIKTVRCSTDFHTCELNVLSQK